MYSLADKAILFPIPKGVSFFNTMTCKFDGLDIHHKNFSIIIDKNLKRLYIN